MKTWLEDVLGRKGTVLHWFIGLFFQLYPLFTLYQAHESSDFALGIFVAYAITLGLYITVPIPHHIKVPVYSFFWIITYIYLLFQKTTALSVLFFTLTVPAILYYGDIIGGFFVKKLDENESNMSIEERINYYTERIKRYNIIIIAICLVAIITPCISPLLKTHNKTNALPPNQYRVSHFFWLSSNDNVGNDWDRELFYHGDELRSGEIVTLPDSFSFQCEVTERDNYPDQGSRYVAFSNLSVGEVQEKTITITVTENRGQHAGNTAVWEVTVTVERLS